MTNTFGGVGSKSRFYPRLIVQSGTSDCLLDCLLGDGGFLSRPIGKISQTYTKYKIYKIYMGGPARHAPPCRPGWLAGRPGPAEPGDLFDITYHIFWMASA